MNISIKKLLILNIIMIFILFLFGILSLNNRFNNKSDDIYTDLKAYISPIFKAAITSSKSNEFKEWFLNGEDEDELQILRKYCIDSIGVDTIDVGSAITNTIYQTGGTKVILNKNNERDKWYFTFMDSDELTSIELYYDSILGTLHVYYNVKVINNGKILGVIGFLIKYDNMVEQLQTPNKLISAYIVNKDGDIFLHNDQTKIGNIDIYDYYGLLQKQKDNENHSNIEMINGLKSVYSLPYIDSYLIVEYYYSIKNIINIYTLMIISLIIISNLVIVLLFIRPFSRKKEMESSSRKLTGT